MNNEVQSIRRAPARMVVTDRLARTAGPSVLHGGFTSRRSEMEVISPYLRWSNCGASNTEFRRYRDRDGAASGREVTMTGILVDKTYEQSEDIRAAERRMSADL